MNTIIEFILYAIGIVILIGVPLALIAGGLASRSVVGSPDTGNDCAAPGLTNQKPNVVPMRPPASNRFEGILINHEGHVTREAPIFASSNQRKPKGSNL
jgi:hypothetical protein